MIYYCRACERIIGPQEVNSLDTKDNPHNPHRNKIVGVEEATFRDELRRTISNLERMGRLHKLR